jgi:hypothetical protein
MLDFRLAYPAQQLLYPENHDRRQTAIFQLLQGPPLLFSATRRPLSTAQRVPSGSLVSLASNRLTSSKTLVKIWTTWNQSTVTAALLKVSSAAARKAGDIADNLKHIVGFSLSLFEKLRECLDVILAFAGHREDLGASFTVHVHEDGDVMMPALRCRFVEADAAQPTEVKLPHGLEHVMLYDAPYAFIGVTDIIGHVLTGISRARSMIACSKSKVHPLPSRALGTLTRWIVNGHPNGATHGRVNGASGRCDLLGSCSVVL